MSFQHSSECSVTENVSAIANRREQHNDAENYKSSGPLDAQGYPMLPPAPAEEQESRLCVATVLYTPGHLKWHLILVLKCMNHSLGVRFSVVFLVPNQ